MSRSLIVLLSYAVVVGAASPAAAFEPTGVTECDDFLTKYEACLAKMDEKNRESYAENLESFAQQYKELSGDEAVRPMLIEQCTADTVDLGATLTADFGCEF
jgi:hypothetical protein